MRRRLLLSLPLAATGCALTQRPYAERRAWPVTVTRPASLPSRPGGPVLLVRTLRAGPGLEARGLQSLQPDGSLRTEFYEEWAVPPAEGVEDQLRRWLADSGIFGAVTAPGSRLVADNTLEGELTALWTEPAASIARTALAITVVHTDAVALQRSFRTQAPLGGPDAPRAALAMRAALAEAFAAIEASLRPLAA